MDFFRRFSHLLELNDGRCVCLEAEPSTKGVSFLYCHHKPKWSSDHLKTVNVFVGCDEKQWWLSLA